MYDNFEIIDKLKQYKKLLKKNNNKRKFKNRIIRFLPFLPGTAFVAGSLIWNISTDCCISPFNLNGLDNYAVVTYADEEKNVKTEELEEHYYDHNARKEKKDDEKYEVQRSTITAYSSYYQLPDGTYMRTASVYDVTKFDLEKAMSLLEVESQGKLDELLGGPAYTYSEQKDEIEHEEETKPHYLLKHYDKGRVVKKTVGDEIGAIVLLILALGFGFIILEGGSFVLIDDHLPCPPSYYSKEDLKKLLDRAKVEIKYKDVDELVKDHFPKRI